MHLIYGNLNAGNSNFKVEKKGGPLPIIHFMRIFNPFFACFFIWKCHPESSLNIFPILVEQKSLESRVSQSSNNKFIHYTIHIGYDSVAHQIIETICFMLSQYIRCIKIGIVIHDEKCYVENRNM